jgi:mRNA interferase MazF
MQERPPLQAGDVVEVDFGTPIGSEAGFVRPSLIVTATAVMSRDPKVFQVVPITSNVTRQMPTEVRLADRYPDRASAAQVHLLTSIPIARLTDVHLGQVASVELAQVRELIADMLDLP